MHDPDPAPRIREKFGLIPPVPGRPEGAGAEESGGREDEERGAPKRVLLVEDEFLLSNVLAADLRGSGYDVVGPFATVSSATDAVLSEPVDCAILDVNLRGELVYPLAEELLRRGIPFLFLSGYEALDLPESFRGHMRLAKPAGTPALLCAVEAMLRAQ
jgi:DNA-binding response OmpR family regulator